MARQPRAISFDSICGMWLEPDQVAVTFTYLGQTYGFCCSECREQFVRAPDVHIVRLAHDPGDSAGYRCPLWRPADHGSDGGPEPNDPER